LRESAWGGWVNFKKSEKARNESEKEKHVQQTRKIKIDEHIVQRQPRNETKNITTRGKAITASDTKKKKKGRQNKKKKKKKKRISSSEKKKKKRKKKQKEEKR